MASGTVVKVGKTYLTKKMIARLGWGKALILLGLATLILKAFEGEDDEDVTIAVEEVDSDEEPTEEGDSGEETEEAAAEAETGDEEATEEEPAEE